MLLYSYLINFLDMNVHVPVVNKHIHFLNNYLFHFIYLLLFIINEIIIIIIIFFFFGYSDE